MTIWILCERWPLEDDSGGFTPWSLVDGVCATTRRSELEDFERDSRGPNVTERRVLEATVTQ